MVKMMVYVLMLLLLLDGVVVVVVDDNDDVLKERILFGDFHSVFLANNQYVFVVEFCEESCWRRSVDDLVWFHL